MLEDSPPGTSFALNLSGLDRPEVTVFELRADGMLLGIGALVELSSKVGEIKSMRTDDFAQRRGVGQAVLDAIVGTARERGYTSILLETGTGRKFESAIRLYLRNGFTRRGAFGIYSETDFNVFYEKQL